MGERELVQEWRKLQIIIQSQQWTRNVEMLRAILNLLHKKCNVVQSIHVLASVFFFFPPYFFPFFLFYFLLLRTMGASVMKSC